MRLISFAMFYRVRPATLGNKVPRYKGFTVNSLVYSGTESKLVPILRRSFKMTVAKYLKKRLR